ncbi:hypothetical protein [Staphylococcus felis]|uniref:hypothetical protein n=1 Tax=Staphylococcus felis TaxID=46127 RepID=UPI003967610E
MRNQDPEIITPDDPRYRNPDDFKHSHSNHEQFQNRPGQFHYKAVGCAPIGCFPGCLLSILLSIILTILLNLWLW